MIAPSFTAYLPKFRRAREAIGEPLSHYRSAVRYVDTALAVNRMLDGLR